jgi:maltooligosyltrehalose trehalohydrolase
VMRRNRLAIACNLGTESTGVPVIGELVLAWDKPIVGDNTTDLPGHSFVILRCA